MISFREYITEAKGNYKDLSLETLKSYKSKYDTTKPEDRTRLNAINSELKRRGETVETNIRHAGDFKHTQKGKLSDTVKKELEATNFTRKVIVKKDDKDVKSFSKTFQNQKEEPKEAVKDLVSTHGKGDYKVAVVKRTRQDVELRKQRRANKPGDKEEYKTKAAEKFIDSKVSKPLPDWKRKDLVSSLRGDGRVSKKLAISDLKDQSEPDTKEKMEKAIQRLEAQIRDNEQSKENYYHSGAAQRDKQHLQDLKLKLEKM